MNKRIGIHGEVSQKRIPALVGPTATGKTKLAIALAQALDGEIVSADSIQVYRGLNIGSAKPTQEEREGVPHHMMDILPADCKDFSVAAYQRESYSIFEDILARGKVPLIAGGTGLYITALENGLHFAETVSDPALRAHWQRKEEEEPGSAHRALAEIDPESGERLHAHDVKRVIRALEIIEHSGLTLGEHQKKQALTPKPYRLIKAGLTMPRELLYERIEKRVDEMLEGGLVDEVAALLGEGVPANATALQGLGYKEMVGYLTGTSTLEEAVEAIKRGTRHFAKRQFTWFRRDQEIRWFDVTEYADLAELQEPLLAYYREDTGMQEKN